jgi:glycosyltransferase involved in cell wall biosynthesis
LPLLGHRATVVANSRAVESDLRANAPSLRTRVVYNGIDVEDFSPGPATGALAALAGMPPPAPGTLSIGLVATYAWWKGHRRFLEAAAEVSSAARGRPLRFYVVGGPIYSSAGSEVTDADLRAIVRERGLVEQVGFVPFQANAAAVYRELDIVVHASERPEPFGRTIVEAMACGRAVVVARAGGAVELFSEGRDALGYEPGQPGDLARAVLELTTDDELRRRIGTAARVSAVERFNRRRLGPELLGLYRELVPSE